MCIENEVWKNTQVNIINDYFWVALKKMWKFGRLAFLLYLKKKSSFSYYIFNKNLVNCDFIREKG